MTDGCLDRFSDDEIELFIAMSAAARRPINWNVLTVDSREAGRIPHQLAAGDRAAEAGARIVALTMPVLVPMNMSFLNHCGLFLIPGWSDVLGLPVPERIAELQEPETQQRMLEQSAAPEAGVFKRLADFANYIIGDTYSAENEGLKGRKVADIAAERGTEPFATLIDIVVADDLRTILWPIPPDGDDASWELRQQVWDDPRAMLGGSDAGAHLDRMCGAPYTTRFLGDTLRGRKLVPIERAVQLITDVPARLFGLKDRGRLVEGCARRPRRLRPGDDRRGARDARPRPAGRHAPAHRAVPRRHPRLRQRRARGRRRRGHRRPPRQDPAVRPGHRNRQHGVTAAQSARRSSGSDVSRICEAASCGAAHVLVGEAEVLGGDEGAELVAALGGHRRAGAAAVDHRREQHDLGAGRLDHVGGLQHRDATGDGVLGDDHPVAGVERAGDPSARRRGP